jgi:XTP/dITP diphosphohydrolase
MVSPTRNTKGQAMPTLLATSNQGKLREVREIAGDQLGELLDLSAFPALGELPEDHDTFEGNARQKAWTAAQKTGLPCLADDSGLAVDALGGAPGVYSARYAGGHGDSAANRQKLLAALEGVPREQRGARFVCVLVLADPRDGTEIVVRGECEGEIGTEEKGSGGFGYDPLFVVPDVGRTMAEISAEEKHARSHRGRAFAELRKKILALGWKPL